MSYYSLACSLPPARLQSSLPPHLRPHRRRLRHRAAPPAAVRRRPPPAQPRRHRFASLAPPQPRPHAACTATAPPPSAVRAPPHQRPLRHRAFCAAHAQPHCTTTARTRRRIAPPSPLSRPCITVSPTRHRVATSLLLPASRWVVTRERERKL
jgi:hypothetical protein